MKRIMPLALLCAIAAMLPALFTACEKGGGGGGIKKDNLTGSWAVIAREGYITTNGEKAPFSNTWAEADEEGKLTFDADGTFYFGNTPASGGTYTLTGNTLTLSYTESGKTATRKSTVASLDAEEMILEATETVDVRNKTYTKTTCVKLSGNSYGNNPPASDPNEPVDINNPQSIHDALRIDQSQPQTGSLPQPTPGNSNLSTSISSIEVNSAGDLILPLMYGTDAQAVAEAIKKVLIQVEGADGHYTVTPTLVNGTAGYGYITIHMPANIDEGSFNLIYMIQDAANSYSNTVSSKVYVTNDVVTCSNASASGSAGLTFTTVALGATSGQVSISYDTYTVPDRIDIYQGADWITGTGTNPNSLIPPMCDCDTPLPGFVGQRGDFTFNFDATKGQQITVVVSGCFGGGTAWNWRLTSAPNCN